VGVGGFVVVAVTFSFVRVPGTFRFVVVSIVVVSFVVMSIVVVCDDTMVMSFVVMSLRIFVSAGAQSEQAQDSHQKNLLHK